MASKTDSLGDRMKEYEAVEAQRKLDPTLPILVRLDGRAFHTFTKGLSRPFDVRFNECMKAATKAVMEESNAKIGYTQSDEITLVILPVGENPNPIFGGRNQKLCSTLAAVASVVFLRKVIELLPPKYVDKLPTFDCRIWNVPNLVEAANAVLWRELDAEKNSVSMMAQSVFSPNELHMKHGGERRDMLQKAGKPWEDLPVQFQRGIYFKKITSTGKLTVEELETLPPKHHARMNPDLMVERSQIREVVFPRLINEVDKVSLLF
jgi:tRNA(His) guanylyltransferase